MLFDARISKLREEDPTGPLVSDLVLDRVKIISPAGIGNSLETCKVMVLIN